MQPVTRKEFMAKIESYSKNNFSIINRKFHTLI